jgi:type I restriction enzyme S subunit
MNADPYITDYSQTYTEFGLQQSKLWPPNTLCITIAGANTAKTAILKFEACFPDSIVGFIPDEKKADLHFVKYSLDRMKHKFLAVTRGATQDNLSLDKLLSFPIPAPPLPIQHRIAGILSAYDDLIENNLRRIKILEEMARSLYREWFVNFRFPGHEKIPLVDSPLGPIPKGWEVKPLSDIVQFKSGFAFKSSTFSTDGDYRLVTIKNVQDGAFTPDCDSRITDLPENLPRYCVLEDGDILLSLTGNVGRVCLVYRGPFLLNQRVAKLMPTDAMDRAFIYCSLRDAHTRVRLEQLSTGVAQQNLSPVLSAKMPFTLPPRMLRAHFASLTNPMIRQIVQLYLSISNLQQTRDLLLPRLLGGHIPLGEATNG